MVALLWSQMLAFAVIVAIGSFIAGATNQKLFASERAGDICLWIFFGSAICAMLLILGGVLLKLYFVFSSAFLSFAAGVS